MEERTHRRGRPDRPRGDRSAAPVDGSSPAGRRLSRAAGLAALLAVAPPLTADAGAARRVSASFGVLGARTVHATATTSGVPGGERVVLEGRRGAGGRSAVRGTGRVRGGVARLRWTFPAGAGALHLRVRVVRGSGSRARTLAASPWRVLRTGDLRRAAPLATVRPGAVVSAPAPGSAGELVLRGGTRLRAGDVVVLPATRATPEGLLVRATGARPGVGSTVVRTVPATLPEVMPVGDLTLAVPAEEPPALRGGPGVGHVLRSLSCASGFPATIAGSASLSAGFRMRLAWRASTSLERPNVTADLRTDVRVAMDAGVGVAGEARCTFDARDLFAAPVRLRRVSTSIGPLPVTLTADGQVALTGEVATNGRLAVAARGGTRGVVRTVYDGTVAKARGALTTRLRPHDPAVTASGGAQVRIAPTFRTRLFGVPGPGVDLGVGVRTSADVLRGAAQPWWTTSALDELGSTFALQALRPDLTEPRVRLYGGTQPLARAPRPAGGSVGLGASRSPDALPPGVRARLRWDSLSVLDVHAWDPAGRHLFFGAGDAIAGARLVRPPGNDTPVVDLEDGGSSAPITVGICQTGGTEANATLDVRAADGGTVRHALTLRGLRAGALVTATPYGAAATGAAPGWCGRPAGDPTAPGEATTGDPPEVAPAVPAVGGARAARVRQTGRVTRSTQDDR